MLDSVVQGGDSVWEGLRVYDGRLFKLDEHLDRLVTESHFACQYLFLVRAHALGTTACSLICQSM